MNWTDCMVAGDVALAVAWMVMILPTVPAAGAVIEIDGGVAAAFETFTATPAEGALGWPSVSVATAVNV